jgi:cytochrome c oxidase cbb3-type subunit 2
MPASSNISGWRGTVLVAVTYVYFLIFAQFAFLARLTQLGIPAAALEPVMAAMAVGGILFSFVTPHLVERFKASTLLRTGFGLSAAAAALSLTPFAEPGAVVIALLIGAGLGIVTVSLVTHLPQWCGTQRPLLSIGVGTGLGYVLCNIPSLFNASPQAQATVAVILCVIGIAAASSSTAHPILLSTTATQTPFPLVLASFAALVWLDSAAFYIIQHTASLKSASWSGPTHLWIIGSIHFAAAVVSALLLRTRQTTLVLCCAAAALGVACLFLSHPASIPAASLLYPAGVSLYSVALVAYPSFLSGANTTRQRAQRAAWIYATAGWIGSAMGIGMGQHLGSVPLAFVCAATAVVAIPALLALLRTYLREFALLASTLVLAFALQHLLPAASPRAASTPIERGRQLYISEGCISCHSQYVRPGTADELMWGPVTPLAVIHAQQPPLIGNRRQGPDLAQIGARRSPLWLQAHLADPAALSYRSPMPSYAFLFSDARGSDLIAYLSSLRTPSSAHDQQQSRWHLDQAAWTAASVTDGARLYQQHCATCHSSNGAARTRWSANTAKLLPDLRALTASTQLQPEDRLAHITKFGIAGTSMPGHEYLSDHDIASLVLWLMHPVNQPSLADSQPTGDIQ